MMYDVNVGELLKMGELIESVFKAHNDILTIAARNGQPKPDDLQTLLKPLSQGIQAIQVCNVLVVNCAWFQSATERYFCPYVSLFCG